MDVELLTKFKAVPVDATKLGHYVQWALQYFHDYTQCTNPELSITLSLDITDLRKDYDQNFSATIGASFTAYLSWRIVQAVKEIPEFNFRDVDGRWYELKNPPAYFPISTQNEERLGDFYVENSFNLDWEEFCREYRKGIEETRAGISPKVGEIATWWSNALFIGNLPHLISRFLNRSVRTDRSELTPRAL